MMRVKRTTRRGALSSRDSLGDDERARASAIIARETLALLSELVPGSLVAVYAAKGSEVDTLDIDVGARALGLRLAYPRVMDDARYLAFHEVRPEDLVPSRFGLREPAPDAPRVELAAIAAFVVPGLAFDRQGTRLGWGRGYYDATFAAAPTALRVGVAFECQLLDVVPRDAHDKAVHCVVTEVAVYRGAGT